MNWKTKVADYGSIQILQERYALDLLTARILSGRGITAPDDVKFYLEGDVSFLNNPFLFEDMTAFCDRIVQAVEEHEKVHVFGDRDADGITSTALLVREFRRLGLDVSWTVPMGDEPYGVTIEGIDAMEKAGETLAVTVDCGISCFDEVEHANSKGIDFLITDHHIPGELIPNAVAVIDPKVEGCGYPFPDLAGCAVAAKCIWALRLAFTPLYNSAFLLLHSAPAAGGTVTIEAARMLNLCVDDRIVEQVVPGILHENNSRLLRFLDCNLPVYVLDEDIEKAQLKAVFPKAEIHVQDLRRMFESYLPTVRGKSLFDLCCRSRFALYSDVRSELDTLIGLFGACMRARYPQLHKDYSPVMELAAIGTVSDLMPLTGENRIIVRSGLKAMEQNPSVSLRPFLSLQNLLGHRLSATDIAWRISPVLNASGRLGQPDIAVRMLLSEDQNEAYTLAQKLMDLNEERKKLSDRAWDAVRHGAQKSYEENGTKMVIVEENESNVPRGLTGLLASRMLKIFNTTCMVISTAGDRAVGSIRSLPGFDCHEWLSNFADMFEAFGGHACAGGFSFSLGEDGTAPFISRVKDMLDYMDCPEDRPEESVEIDTRIEHADMNEKLIRIVEKLEPYGEKSEQPVFMLESVRLTDMAGMRNSSNEAQGHLRMNIQLDDGVKWPAVFWGAGPRAGKDFTDGGIADIVFRMNRNYFRGQESIQLNIIDIRSRTKLDLS